MKGQRHAPAALYLREISGAHCTGGWVDPRAGLDRCGKSRSTGIRSLDRPAHSHSLTDYATRPTKYMLALGLEPMSFVSEEYCHALAPSAISRVPCRASGKFVHSIRLSISV